MGGQSAMQIGSAALALFVRVPLVQRLSCLERMSRRDATSCSRLRRHCHLGSMRTIYMCFQRWLVGGKSSACFFDELLHARPECSFDSLPWLHLCAGKPE